jgi:hypothetical protein
MHRVSGDNSNETERYPFGFEGFPLSFAAPMHFLQHAIYQTPATAPVRRFGHSLRSRSVAGSRVWQSITPETQLGNVPLKPKFARDYAAA